MSSLLSLGGLAAPMVLLFINGFGLMIVLNPCNTYCVDSMQQRSAEVVSSEGRPMAAVLPLTRPTLARSPAPTWCATFSLPELRPRSSLSSTGSALAGPTPS